MSDEMDPIAEFWRISIDATQRVSKTFNAPDVMPYGKQIIQLVELHPDKRQKFVDAFIEGAGSPETCDRWLIEFCMHALRIPEAKLEFERLSREAIAQNNWNKIQPLQHILDAFEDTWEDADDIYADYFRH
jgi:hypothetical protein